MTEKEFDPKPLTNTEEDNEEGSLVRRPRRHVRPEQRDNNQMLPLRNVLNLIFMLGAVVGVILYYTGHPTTGIIIVLVAVVVKMVEAAIRMIVK